MPHETRKYRHTEDHGNGWQGSHDVREVKLDEQAIIPWAKGFFPLFSIGQQVWVIQPKKKEPQWEIAERFIDKINCDIVCWDEKDGPQLIIASYALDKPMPGANFFYIPGTVQYNIFATKEEAEKEIVWHPVDLPHEVYLAACGFGPNGERDTDEAEDCECPPGCCGNMGAFRDIIESCMINKGAIDRFVRRAEHLINGHEKPIENTNLKRICEALGMEIDWSKP